MWNVKERLTSHVAFCALDLIDTLWNVKAYDPFRDHAGGVDLIDTLWNVKKAVYPLVGKLIWI